MINHIIKSFQPKLEGFEVDIKTALGSVEASEGFRLVAKKEGKKINATITYQQDHAVRYALNALLKFAQTSENSIDISSAPDFKVRGVVEGVRRGLVNRQCTRICRGIWRLTCVNLASLERPIG